MTYDELEADNAALRALCVKLADALMGTIDYDRPPRKRSRKEASAEASRLWVARMDAVMDYVAMFGGKP